MPAALLALTVVTGLVDAVSILSLGRVFVANMTGNVVFVGFAAAGAPGFSLSASLSALAGFVVGALCGGRLAVRDTARWRRLLDGLVAETGPVLVALVLVASTTAKPGGPAADITAALLAVGLGVQNAMVRSLKVPDLTTTVLTLTLTGIFADVRNQPRAVVVRRVLAVAAMLGGAATGAVLDLHVDATAALAVACGLLLGCLAVSAERVRRDRSAATVKPQQPTDDRIGG